MLDPASGILCDDRFEDWFEFRFQGFQGTGRSRLEPLLHFGPGVFSRIELGAQREVQQSDPFLIEYILRFCGMICRNLFIIRMVSGFLRLRADSCNGVEIWLISVIVRPIS